MPNKFNKVSKFIEDVDSWDEELRAKEAQKINAAAKEISAEFNNLPGSFSQTLKYHMKKRKISVEALSWESGISTKSIGTYRNDSEANPDFTTVLALCKGLYLGILVPCSAPM